MGIPEMGCGRAWVQAFDLLSPQAIPETELD
jgi:hypothetical protein